jgi:hypothetical protein
MKLKKNTDFRIAKGLLNDIFAKTEPLDNEKWVQFVENHSDYFTWNEDTEDGKKTLENIDEISEEFKERVLASLNKGGCFAEFDEHRNLYNISVGINKEYNWITIQFARTPKMEDLKIFVEMAKHLDALLLKDGKEIIDEKMIENLK